MSGDDETTPLLRGGPPVRPSQPTRSLPAVLPAVSQLKIPEASDASDRQWCPNDLSDPSLRAAFTLTVLLRTKHNLLHRRETTKDIWEQWSSATDDVQTLTALDERIFEDWTTFLSVPRSCHEIAQVLWSEFPLSEDEYSRSTRVMDHVDVFPVSLLTHPVVELSFVDTWRHGLHGIFRSNSQTVAQRAWEKLDASCTPRTCHLLEVAWFAVYLAMITHYALAPPLDVAVAVSALGVIRATIILVTVLSRLMQRWNLSTVPFLFTALAFIVALPSTPRSPGLGYDILLFALALHILQLHLPHPPGPLFLLPFKQALPLATTLWKGFSSVYVPCLMLFAPASALVLALLSYSLENTDFINVMILAAPLDARTMFLCLLGIFLILLLCSLAMLILIFPGTSTHPSPGPWDRYTLAVGLDARRILARTLTLYSSLYYFPVPFNIVQRVFVELPYLVAHLFVPDGKLYEQKAYLDRWLWRVFVGVPALVVTGVLALLDRMYT